MPYSKVSDTSVPIDDRRLKADLGTARILHVFPSFEVGGIQRRCVTILNAAGGSFRSEIIALDGNYESAGGLVETDQTKIQAGREPPRGYLSSLGTARRVLSAQRPDLLLTYNWSTLDWALVNGLLGFCPHIHHEDGFNLDEADGQFARRILYRRLSLLRCRFVIVPSQCLRRISLEQWRLPAERIRYVPNGVDWRAYQSTGLDLRDAGGRKSIVLGTMVPMRPEKNLEAMFRVFAGLRENCPCELRLIGDGPERSHLEVLARELGLAGRVVFEGHRDDIPDALVPIDIFVMTSRTEQMPIGLLQAMAAAKPVAAYSVGDIKDMVSTENAPYIVPRDDEVALGKALSALMESEALRAELGARNLKRVQESYREDEMVAHHLAIYAEALARPLH